MIVNRMAAVAAVVVMVATACGNEPEPPRGGEPEMTAELRDALGRVKSTVDDLVAQLGHDAEASPASNNEEVVSCKDPGGAPNGEFRSQFGYVIDVSDGQPIATIHNAHAFFAAHQLDVDTGQLSADPPAIFADGEGYRYSAVVNAEGAVVVGGTTPCYPASSSTTLP
jgi:hypothetical protein